MVRPDLHPDSNIYVTYRLRKGDTAAGWEQADVVVEGTYDLPYQEHAYLQPEAAVSWIDRRKGRITVAVAGQWTHEDSGADRPRPRPPGRAGAGRSTPPSAALGGREDMSLQIVMALAPWRLADRGERRPIRCQWSREESMVGHHKRHRRPGPRPVGRHGGRSGRGGGGHGATRRRRSITARPTRCSGTSTCA